MRNRQICNRRVEVRSPIEQRDIEKALQTSTGCIDCGL